MTNNKYLNDYITATVKGLERVKANGTKDEWHFEIDCGAIEDFHNREIKYDDKYAPIYERLKSVHGPVLYWMQIMSDVSTEEITKTLLQYKNGKDARSTPSLKKHINFNTGMLYAELTTEPLWVRLVQHLGFYESSAVQGLQLFYWATELKLKLRVTVLEFNGDMGDVLPLIEDAFARKLQPLLGKVK